MLTLILLFPNAEENQGYGHDLYQLNLTCKFSICSQLLGVDVTHISTFIPFRAHAELAANERGHMRTMACIYCFIYYGGKGLIMWQPNLYFQETKSILKTAPFPKLTVKSPMRR